MENQHRKIQGYRELSQEEVDLMNQFKKKGGELIKLYEQLKAKLDADYLAKRDAVDALRLAHKDWENSTEFAEFTRFTDAEPKRWASIGKTDVQTAIMAFVRAVAQPRD